MCIQSSSVHIIILNYLYEKSLIAEKTVPDNIFHNKKIFDIYNDFHSFKTFNSKVNFIQKLFFMSLIKNNIWK